MALCLCVLFEHVFSLSSQVSVKDTKSASYSQLYGQIKAVLDKLLANYDQMIMLHSYNAECTDALHYIKLYRDVL